jgi:Leucine-rich repeat (LRR) protein
VRHTNDDDDANDGGAPVLKPAAPPSVATPGVPANATLADPAFQQWMRSVAALPAQQQVDAVTKKLMELNPKSSGLGKSKLTSTLDGGIVIGLAFHSAPVTKLAPVRALIGLKSLECNRTPVYDLSPLQGMSLTALNIGSTSVSDLSPLRGMPLTVLNCDNTQVSDLSPLAGCKQLQTLITTNSKVTPEQINALKQVLPNCKIQQ